MLKRASRRIRRSFATQGAESREKHSEMKRVGSWGNELGEAIAACFALIDWF
jgi:hypothetical protein